QVSLALAEPVEEITAGAVTARPERIDLPGAKADLDFIAEGRGRELRVGLSYATSLFDAEDARPLLRDLRVVVEGVAAAPSRRLSRLPILTEAESHRELVEWNDTAADFPVMCIHEGFEQQVARTPDGIAAELDGATITYAELNADANRMARRL